MLLAAAIAIAISGSASPGAAPSPSQSRDVLLAVQQNGRLHFLDARTLEPIARLAAHKMAARVSASPDGTTLFLGQADTIDGNGCCSLFAVELASRRVCKLLDIAPEGVPSADGRWLFAHRGMGIDVFDMPTLARLPSLRGPRLDVNYRLHPSPDSRWLFALTVWRDLGLDIFDLRRGGFVRHAPVIGMEAAWLGSQFHVLGQRDGKYLLQTIASDSADAAPPVPLEGAAPGLPDRARLVAGERQLFAFRPSAPWFIKGRRDDGTPWSRGIWTIDVQNRRVAPPIAVDVEVADLVAGADGTSLYALEPGTSTDRPATAVRLDAATGRIAARRELPADSWGWSIALVSIPASLVPNGEVAFAPCAR
jgi:hypothetical protein